MENPLPRSRPVAVTVASDKEPVVCDGVLTQANDGFVLEFSVGNDKFDLVHGGGFTRVSATGDMSYDIELKEHETSTVLSTPFGMVRFAVKPIVRDVETTENGIRVKLKYILASTAAGEIERTVDIAVRFFN